MTNRPRLQAYPKDGSITIATGTTDVIKVKGNFVYVKAADQSFTLRMDGTNDFTMSANRKVRLSADDTFSTLEVINNSGSNLTYQLEVGFGDIETNDLAITGELNVQQGGDTLVTAADVTLVAATATQIVAAESTRKEILIHNNTGAAIRVGDSNVGAARGVQVATGGTIVLNTSAAISAYSAGGGTVSFTEVRS